MQESKIVNILNNNDLGDVEVLKKGKDFTLVNFYFDFDKDVLDAAKAFANEESNEEENSSKWLNEYYFTYLYDFANDEVLDIIEEIIDETELEGEIMAIQMTEKTKDYVQFMALFSEENSDVVIEDVVREFLS